MTVVIKQQTAHPLAPLAALRQFIAVRLVPRPDGRTDKLPLDLQGNVADAHVPAHWTSWADAHALATRLGPMHTIGFVITKDCGFVCLDVDHCVSPTGEYTQIVHDLAAQLGPHVAWELSQSGRGLHLWMRAPHGGMPPHSSKDTTNHTELYSELRFVALGQAFAGEMEQPCDGLAAVAARYFPAKVAAGDVVWDAEYRHPDWVGPPLSDDEVVRLCSSISNIARAAGHKATFAELMKGDSTVLARYYPNKDGGLDHSGADQALFNDLMWAAGHNAAQVVRIARMSGLARDKWEREDYLARTLARAAAGQGCYKAKSSSALARAELLGQHSLAAPTEVQVPHQGAGVSLPQAVVADATSTAFVTREQQLSLFAGHCYVLDQHRILTPRGMLLGPDQFRALHGGSIFALGGERNKTTANAWEAFTENQDVTFPRAESTCFRPEHPFGAIVDEGGLKRVNTYRDVAARRPGDASLMVDHIGKLFPVGDDSTIVLSALAALVQYPGRKFNWCLVLQSGPGAGKNMIANAMIAALGDPYAILLDEDDLAAKFNGWLAEKVLCVFPELPPRAAARALEKLKTLITDGRARGIERKNRDKVATNVCANFLFLTNHRDALRKDINDRRFCILYSRFQTQAELAAAGMGAAYFKRLAEWLRGDGEAIFAHWLAEFDIPERFDPTKGAHVAPATSSTSLAIELGRSEVAQILAEAIDDEEPGFVGDLVSWGLAKQKALDARHLRGVTDEELRQALEGLGFLRWGKTDNVVMPDARKTTLYLRVGAELGGKSNAQVAKIYSDAQKAAKTARDAGVAEVGR